MFSYHQGFGLSGIIRFDQGSTESRPTNKLALRDDPQRTTRDSQVCLCCRQSAPPECPCDRASTETDRSSACPFHSEHGGRVESRLRHGPPAKSASRGAHERS